MDIETLKSKVANNEEKIAKKQAFIKRNEEKVAKLSAEFETKYGISYDKYDYQSLYKECCNDETKWNEVYLPSYKLSDKIDNAKYSIENATKEIAKLQKVLQGWNEKLAKEMIKDSKRNNPIIMEFLDKWELDCYSWLDSEYDTYKKAREEFYQREDIVTLSKATSNYSSCKERREAYHKLSELEKEFKENFPPIIVKRYTSNKDKYLQDIKTILAKEKIAKYDDMVDRVELVVGNITNAEGLKISANGNLNGIIIGDKAKANLETIGAGGYNIQCFHYRTLVYPID